MIVKTSRLILGLALGAAILVAAPVAADHDHDHGAESLGKVAFPVSCQPGQQAAFNRAVALVHSFGRARRARFQEIATADPQCAMAQWHSRWPTTT
jgi:hypothetical protein